MSDYLDRLSQQLPAVKQKAAAMLADAEQSDLIRFSDWTPFSPYPEFTATNAHLSRQPFNTNTANAADYAKYPVLNADTVLMGDDSDLRVIMPQRPALGQICIIDWLNVTLQAATFDDDISRAHTSPQLRQRRLISNFSATLQDLLGFGVSHQLKTGANFYESSYQLDHNAGKVCIGGQNDTILLMLSGTGCTYAKHGWQHALHDFLLLRAKDPKITRIDLAHDDLNGDYTNLAWFVRQHDKGGFNSTNRTPEIELRGNWKRPNGKGRSVYIGTAKASKYCRIYEKGKQLGDKSSPWVRVEVEFKAKSIFIPIQVLIDPSPFFLAAYPCFHIFDDKHEHQRATFERIDRQNLITFAHALDITKHQFGRYLYAFRAEFVKHGLTDSALLDVLTQLDNKAYPERLDALTIPEFFKPQAN